MITNTKREYHSFLTKDEINQCHYNVSKGKAYILTGAALFILTIGIAFLTYNGSFPPNSFHSSGAHIDNFK